MNEGEEVGSAIETPGATSPQALGDGPVLVEFLGRHAAPCPSCGYELRGLKTNRCPECGEALALRVGLAEPKLAWFVSALVGVAFGAGFSILLLVFFFWMTVIEGDRGDPEGFLLITGTGSVVEGGLLLGLVFGRKRLSRLVPEARWTICGVAWVLTIINLSIFTAHVR